MIARNQGSDVRQHFQPCKSQAPAEERWLVCRLAGAAAASQPCSLGPLCIPAKTAIEDSIVTMY